ncbi:MAG TPA: hypothetical protein VID24_07085 [Candidatus Eremiobacteraceae bacterium]
MALAAVCAVAAVSPPARAAFDAIMNCSSSAPCLEWDNGGGGDAIKGVSIKGNALHGQTKYKSAGKTSGKAGVFGEDLSTAGNLDAGVSGVSKNGAGVIGTSTGWNGMEGFSSGTGTSGVYGQTSVAGFGVAGRDTATTYASGAAGILADGGTANDGLHAVAYGGQANAISAYSQYGSALVLNAGPGSGAALSINGVAPNGYMIESTDPQGTPVFLVFGDGGEGVYAENGTAGTFRVARGLDFPVLFLQSGTAGTNHDAFELYDTNGFDQTRITDAGNIYTAGHIFTSGSCSGGCIVNGKQVRRVAEYTPAEAEPTVEDNGEATLSGGRADVALDPKFANVIDRGSAYLVTVTPEGDCRGLYVTDRTIHGFTVRELQGGHASVGFAYRIVAQRFGDHAERLPMMTVQHAPLSRVPRHRQSPSSR